MMMCDWTMLPADLLRTIAELLTTDAVDYIRFRSVCSPWRSSCPRSPPHAPTQFPWLLLPYMDTNKKLQQFYNIAPDKTYKSISLPYSLSRCRLGSSQGWLAFLDSSTGSLFLVNPITGLTLPLPSLASFPDDVCIKKIVLSSNPCVDQSYIVLAMLNQTNKIAFCRKGDHFWTYIEKAESYCRDIVYRGGLFYTVNRFRDIVVCDVQGPEPRVSIINTTTSLKPCDLQYLATSLNSDLLFIRRYLDFSFKVGYHTTSFEVFRLDLREEKWAPVTELGGEVVFLGENSTFVLSSDEFHGARGNCIYYTDDRQEYNYMEGDTDSGIYDLGNKTFDRLPHNSNLYNARFCPPLWLTPYPFQHENMIL